MGRYVNAVFRADTNIFSSRNRSVVRSSGISSAKYCCSRSSLRFVRGNTTIDRRGASPGRELEAVDDTLAVGASVAFRAQRINPDGPRDALDALLAHVLEGLAVVIARERACFICASVRSGLDSRREGIDSGIKDASDTTESVDGRRLYRGRLLRGRDDLPARCPPGADDPGRFCAA
jgi:hypothetical protein